MILPLVGREYTLKMCGLFHGISEQCETKRPPYICSLIFLKSSKSCKATDSPSAMRLQLSAPPPMNLCGRKIGAYGSSAESFISCYAEIQQCETDKRSKFCYNHGNHLNYLLDAVDPRHKLKGRARWCVTLDVGLRRAVYCVEHHEAVLCPSILEGQRKHRNMYISNINRRVLGSIF